ncbi:nuclear transport factor 2 family protein [Sabulibacter ruber]|uniref:nuclear transport factor 2 family protein n=1 Tax=Sabulibacter ruber TaxID=2811901 RepID=UPI001A967E3B|nr:nuclear transport factor 2 family protein [Sabulibacter ruber]
MKTTFTTVASLALLLFLGSFSQTKAQPQQDPSTTTLLHLDSIFWSTYNLCDLATMENFVADDLEFFHDKGGITLGKANFISSVANNLCGNENFKVRREAVAETIKVFPMYKAGELYGVIISGDHLFYNQQKGEQEFLAGVAKFANLWLLQDNTWKMARVFSYDHGPAPYQNSRKAISLPVGMLSQFIGEYDGPTAGRLTIQQEDSALILLTNHQKIALHPETQNRFFARERDLTFEFISGNGKAASKMVVRENGNVVEEAVLHQKK